jgi:type II secretory pathway component PulC
MVATVPATPAVPAPPPRTGVRSAPGSTSPDATVGEPEGLPKLTLQFLVYSDTPQERLVFINNQKYVEGQSIEGKVMVEAIQPDGVTLSYQGKRFRLRQ